MPRVTWDTIIVGQGLAGTTLAWHLIEAGQRVLLLDADEPVTSSKIAAGLITPVTGRRLVLTDRIGAFLPVAQAFYARIEECNGQKFFHARTAVRLFQSDAERQIWAQRCQQPAVQVHLASPQPAPLLDADIADTGGGGFAMQSAQLDVAAFLVASRATLASEPAIIDWQRDVTFEADHVAVRGHHARRVISCEGYAATRNPYFSSIKFQAAKGEILTIRVHRPMPPLTFHRGIWIAPTGAPDVFRVGATYDLKTLDQMPTRAGRAELEGKLQAFLRVPYAVIDHQAAVRPIIYLSKPLIGLHPDHDRLGFFNGLGSKGALLAPWFAHCLTQHLVNGAPLPDDADVRRQF
jgi:glycine oxidase